jgi:hypothetical protein
MNDGFAKKVDANRRVKLIAKSSACRRLFEEGVP